MCPNATMAHIPRDTGRVREARVAVVAPLDDHRYEPTSVVGVDIETDGDGVVARGRSMATAWCACGIVMVSICLAWLATRAVSYGWASVAITFTQAASYAAVDLSICDVDSLRVAQWAALAVTLCLFDRIGCIFWRDGIALVVVVTMRLVGVCAMHRRQVYGSAVHFIWIMAYLFCAKTLLVTYGYHGWAELIEVLYLLTFVGGVQYLTTRVLTDDAAALSPADLCVFGGCAFAFVVSNYVAFISLDVNSMALAVLLIAVQRVTLRTLIPFSKKLLGDHWRLALIPAMLSVELGPALLLARIETLGDLEFWGTFCLQEMNSLAKNLGWYDAIVVHIGELFGRSVSATARAASTERRVALAPCDNLAEVLAPVFVSVAVMFGYGSNRGIALVGMVVVFSVRVAFAVVESMIERRQVEHTSIGIMIDSIVMSTAPLRVKASMAVLFSIQPVYMVLLASDGGRASN